MNKRGFGFSSPISQYRGIYSETPGRTFYGRGYGDDNLDIYVPVSIRNPTLVEGKFTKPPSKKDLQPQPKPKKVVGVNQQLVVGHGDSECDNDLSSIDSVSVNSQPDLANVQSGSVKTVHGEGSGNVNSDIDMELARLLKETHHPVSEMIREKKKRKASTSKKGSKLRIVD